MHAERAARPCGKGRFLLKVGTRPGLPLQADLTEPERDSADNNRGWDDVSRFAVRKD